MATSPLRPLGGLLDEQDMINAELPADADVRRGIRSTGASMSAGFLADEALRAESSQNPAFSKLRDQAIATAQEGAAVAPRVRSLRDVHGVGDFVDMAQGMLPGGVLTTLPSFAGGLAGRAYAPFAGAAGLTAFAGASVPAYYQERGEAALDQYQDPALSRASVRDRDAAATGKGLINAGLEAAVPAGLAVSAFRKPTGSFLGHVARTAGEEALTEAAQQGVGFGAQKYLDPSRQLDPIDIADAAIGGAIGGGGMSMAGAPAHFTGGAMDAAGAAAGAVKGAMPTMPKFGRGDVDPNADPTAPVPGDGGGSGDDSFLGKAVDLAGAVKDRFGGDVKDAGAATVSGVGKAKDAVSGAIDRMTDSIKAGDDIPTFMQKTFGSAEDDAAADLSGADSASLKGATFEETESNLARDDASREARAKRYADMLTNDDASSPEVKSRVAGFTDFTDPETQAYVARTLVAQRGGEKIGGLVDSLVKMSDGLARKAGEMTGGAVDKVADMAGDAKLSAQERIIKKNLQSATPSENAAYGKMVFDNLTEGAQANPQVRARLQDITNAMFAFAAKTGDVTAKDLPVLTKISDAMSLFKDPEAFTAQLVQYANLPRGTDSFLGRIKDITNAQQDIKQPNSFLQTSLTPDAKRSMTAPMLSKVAQLVDQFSVLDSASSKRGDAIIKGLGAVMGGEESARAVIDYYAKQNKANLIFDPAEGDQNHNSDDEANLTSADDAEGFGKLTEQDAKELAPNYRSRNVNRPFVRGRDDAEIKARMGKGGDMVRVSSLADHVEATEGNARLRAFDIRRDLSNRIENHMQRDTASVAKKIELIEAHFADKDSSDTLYTTAEETEMRGELARLKKMKTEDRTAMIAPLREELKAQDAAATAAKKAGKNPSLARLGIYDVVLDRHDGTTATDEDMTAFRSLLDKKPMPGTENYIAKTKAINDTKITVEIDGKPVNLSLESMVYNSPEKGTVKQRLSASLAAVAARADAFPTIPKEAVVKRNYFGPGKNLTWGDLDLKDVKPGSKKVAPLPADTQEKRNAREALDFSTRAGMMEALKETADHYPLVSKWLSSAITKKEALSKEIDQRKNSGDFVPAHVFEQIKELTSKVRVLTTYARELIAEAHPLESKSEFVAGFVGDDENTGSRADETAYRETKYSEEEYEVNKERAEMAKGIPTLAAEYTERAETAQKELDKNLSAMQDFQRMGDDSRINTRPETKGPSREGVVDVRERLAEAQKELAAAKNASVESFMNAHLPGDGSVSARTIPAMTKARKAATADKAARIAELEDRVNKWSTKEAPKAEAEAEEAAAPEAAKPLAQKQWDALFDTVLQENYSAVNTPARVLGFARTAKRAMAEIQSLSDEFMASDRQELLLHELKNMFAKDTSFDWNMQMTEQDGYTDADLAALHDIVGEEALGPKAEPGAGPASKKNAQRPESAQRGFPDDGITSVMDKAEKQRIYDEIVKLRGDDVRVRFGKFAQIGGSGDFSMNADKTQRVIRIAIDSLNPMGVAWHESLHDFMAMLGTAKEERQLKKDLLEAAGSPQVMTRLRELLKGHPEALLQLSDKEERLAYMYQFWAQGGLKIGTAGNNIFERVAQMIRDVLGVLSKDQKVVKLLEAFHEGKFANPGTTQEVLADLQAKTLGDRLREVAGPLANVSEVLMTSTTDRLRNTHITALEEIADLFHRDPGNEAGSSKLPFLQTRAQEAGKHLNQLQKIFEDTTAVERRAALENMQAMKAPSSTLEKALAGYLAEMHDYMAAAGVKSFDSKSKMWNDLGKVTNYFPRVWDKNIIRNKEAEFVKMLTAEVGAKQARATFEALVNGDGSLELTESEHNLGFTPFAPAVQNRQFTFINPSNAAAWAAFQSKDMADIMTSYVQRGVHRAEYARVFGNNGELMTQKFLEAQQQGATPEDLKMARKATMALEGTLGHDFNPRLKELFSTLITVENITLLPLSLFSNLIDPLGVAVRSGEMKEAYKALVYGLQGLVRQVRGKGTDEHEDLAKLMGLIDDQNMLESMGQVYNSMHMSRQLKTINNKFFKYNGMETWNQRMRVAGMLAGQRFIAKNINDERYMAELGLTPSDVFIRKDNTIAVTAEQIQEEMDKKIGNGVSKGSLQSAKDKEKLIQAALMKFTDGAVLRPNAAHRPIWGSDPRFALVFHLKQFTYSFQNVILKRVSEEIRQGKVAPAWILASYVPFMLASDVLKGTLTGTLSATPDLWTLFNSSLQRSGVMGTGAFYSDAMADVKKGQIPGTSFLGPSFDHIMTILGGLTGRVGPEAVLNRSVPGAKYF